MDQNKLEKLRSLAQTAQSKLGGLSQGTWSVVANQQQVPERHVCECGGDGCSVFVETSSPRVVEITRIRQEAEFIAWAKNQLQELCDAAIAVCDDSDPEKLREQLEQMVGSYQPPTSRTATVVPLNRPK